MRLLVRSRIAADTFTSIIVYRSDAASAKFGATSFRSAEAHPGQVSWHSRRLKSRLSPFPSNADMRPGRANPKHLSLQPSSVFETMEQKRRRLRPDLFPDSGTSGGDGVSARAVISSSSGSAPLV